MPNYQLYNPLDTGAGAAAGYLAGQQERKQKEIDNAAKQAEFALQQQIAQAQYGTAPLAQMGKSGVRTAKPQPAPTVSKVAGKQPKSLGTVTSKAQMPPEKYSTYEDQYNWALANFAANMQAGHIGAAQAWQQELNRIDQARKSAETDARFWAAENERIWKDHAQVAHWSQQDQEAYARIAEQLQAAIIRGDFSVQDANIRATAAIQDTDKQVAGRARDVQMQQKGATTRTKMLTKALSPKSPAGSSGVTVDPSGN